jgi:DNA-binding response OmpR family regulator
MTATRGHLLVVEDSRLLRRLIADVLRSAGWSVLEASDGIEAAALLAQHQERKIDLRGVILDLMLPRLDGLSVLRALRQEGLTLPVLVVSGDQAHWPAATAAGATCIVPKPFEPQDLLALVEQHCAPPPA